MPVPTDFIQRHLWLCERLRESRLRDALTIEPVTAGAPSPIGVHLAGATEWTFYEIISDGGGQAEPYWHGLVGKSGEYRLLSPEERDELGAGIAREREKNRQKFKVVADTHRDLGRFFAEPLVFRVTGKRNERAYRADETVTVLTPRGSETWLDYAGKRIATAADNTTLAESLEQDLRILCEHVLWPEFWRKHPALQSFVSIIYIQGSIVHSDCGVWAIHVGASGVSDLDFVSSSDPHPFFFIDPAEHCLNHVLIAELHESGAHKRRISDLQFVGRALGLLGAPLGSEVALYRFLNEEVDMESPGGDHPITSPPVGHQLYTRAHQADYLTDYSSVFELCVGRLAQIDPTYLQRLEHPYFRTAAILFVARRIQELQSRLVAQNWTSLPDSSSSLASLLIQSLCPTCFTRRCGADHREDLVTGANWLNLLKRVTTVAEAADYPHAYETRAVIAALWALASLSTWDRHLVPHEVDLLETRSDWAGLHNYLNTLLESE
jgi:hypothetical protein